MNRFIVLFSLFLGSSAVVLAAHAQPWELGSTELFPTNHAVRTVATAASRHAHLVVWTEEHRFGSAPAMLYASRVSSQGKVLDPSGLYVGLAGRDRGPFVASDGEDFLVAWYAEQEFALRTTRITANGEVIAGGGPERLGYPLGLAFNGRTYAMAAGTSIVLLDRNGLPISGTLTLRHIYRLLERAGKWIVIGNGLQWGEIGEADFPPVGQRRELALENGFEESIGNKRALDIAVTANGFVTAGACYCNPANIVVRWHDGDRREAEDGHDREHASHRDRSKRGLRERRIDVDGEVDEIRLVVDGDDVYVAFHVRRGSFLAHIVNGRIREVMPQPPIRVAVSPSPLGTAAFWIDQEDEQLYAARLTSAELSLPAQHVTKRLSDQLHSTLVSGAGVHLALWKESSRDRLATYYALLTTEGRPFIPARMLDGRGEFAAASDGSSFLIVWEKDAETFGSCIVAPDGTITSGPFAIPHRRDEIPGSLVWDGKSTYILNLFEEGAFMRFSQKGEFLERIAIPELRHASIGLRQVDGGFVGLVYDAMHPGCACAWQIDARVVVLDRNLVSDPVRADRWRDREWEWSSWSATSAFVTAAGHRFFVRDDRDGVLYAVGDDGETHRLPYRGAGAFYYGLAAGWTGAELLVAAGDVLGHHAPDGTFLRISALPPGTIVSSIAADEHHVPIVLTERLVGPKTRLLLMRLEDH